MLAINRSGPTIADVIASVRDVPGRIVPYAVSTALTRTAQRAAQVELPAEMRKVFRNPVSYTLNSLRVVPAKKDALSARVMVKDQAAGLAPENYLLPEVEGGGRKHKRLEMAMRYAGVLKASQYAMPGAGLPLDAAGNVRASDVRSILSALGTRGAQAAGSTKRRSRKLKGSLFVGKPSGGDRPEGVWMRDGKRLRPLFVFTDSAPTYRPRLDFSAVVQRVAMDRFRPEFEKALADMQARG